MLWIKSYVSIKGLKKNIHVEQNKIFTGYDLKDSDQRLIAPGEIL